MHRVKCMAGIFDSSVQFTSAFEQNGLVFF